METIHFGVPAHDYGNPPCMKHKSIGDRNHKNGEKWKLPAAGVGSVMSIPAGVGPEPEFTFILLGSAARLGTLY